MAKIDINELQKDQAASGKPPGKYPCGIHKVQLFLKGETLPGGNKAEFHVLKAQLRILDGCRKGKIFFWDTRSGGDFGVKDLAEFKKVFLKLDMPPVQIEGATITATEKTEPNKVFCHFLPDLLDELTKRRVLVDVSYLPKHLEEQKFPILTFLSLLNSKLEPIAKFDPDDAYSPRQQELEEDRDKDTFPPEDPKAKTDPYGDDTGLG